MAQQQNKKQGSRNICWAANTARWALPRLCEAEPSVLADLEDNMSQGSFPTQEIQCGGDLDGSRAGVLEGKVPGIRGMAAVITASVALCQALRSP